MNAFSNSGIKIILLPENVTKICRFAFNNCRNLRKIEFPKNSDLQTIESQAFAFSVIKELFLPNKQNELKDMWCFSTDELTKITISPSNDKFAW